MHPGMILPAPMKPIRRVRPHAVALPAAASPLARATCAGFALTACLLFGASAPRHRGRRTLRTSLITRRLDHAGTLMIIAGTNTPIAAMLLPEPGGTTVVTEAWAAAITGAATKVI
jgi:hemolysin III